MMEDALAVAVATLAGTLRLATPLILASVGGLMSERAGIVDVGLEGKMLAGAFAAAAAAAVTGSAWAGLAAALATGLALALLHGVASITWRGNQVVSGMAINILASGLTIVLGEAWFRMGGQTPALDAAARFVPLRLDWPNAAGLGRVLAQTGFVYAALLSVPAAGWVLARTRFGLHLRAVGEAPEAVEAAGISVAWLRYRAVALCGLLAGAAGAYLSIAQGAGFSRDMSAGQGYIALAALVFGRWRPVPTLLACLLFGFIDAVAIRLQGVALPGLGEVPVQLVQALPYGLTVILLAGLVGRAVAPRASGVPYP